MTITTYAHQALTHEPRMGTTAVHRQTTQRTNHNLFSTNTQAETACSKPLYDLPPTKTRAETAAHLYHPKSRDHTERASHTQAETATLPLPTPLLTARRVVQSTRKVPPRSLSAPTSRGKPVDLIGEAFASRTTSKHINLLGELEEFVSARTTTSGKSQQLAPAAGGPLSLTPAMLSEYLEMRRLNPRARTRSGKSCKWSSSRTLLGSILGAVRDAPFHGSRLTMKPNDPSTRKIDRTIKKRVYAERVDFPFAATVGHVNRALDLLERAPLPPMLRLMCLVYLLLWWATAARSGDALQLQSWAIVTLRTSHGMPLRSVKFVEGKGVTLRGPYTVHTLVPRQHLLDLLMTNSEDYIFPPQFRQKIADEVLGALKKADPRIEMRSIRRGSLQALAMADVDEQTLMTFSGHKCLPTLHRYLDWGTMRGLAQTAGGEAAFAAWGQLLQKSQPAGSAYLNC